MANGSCPLPHLECSRARNVLEARPSLTESVLKQGAVSPTTRKKNGKAVG